MKRQWIAVTCLCVWLIQEITTLYEKNEWKKHDKEPILFKFSDNKQPITAKLSAVNGHGWEAELEGGDKVKGLGGSILYADLSL